MPASLAGASAWVAKGDLKPFTGNEPRPTQASLLKAYDEAAVDHGDNPHFVIPTEHRDASAAGDADAKAPGASGHDAAIARPPAPAPSSGSVGATTAGAVGSKRKASGSADADVAASKAATAKDDASPAPKKAKDDAPAPKKAKVDAPAPKKNKDDATAPKKAKVDAQPANATSAPGERMSDAEFKVRASA